MSALYRRTLPCMDIRDILRLETIGSTSEDDDDDHDDGNSSDE